MGYQHGRLLRDEIASLPRWFIKTVNGLAKIGLAQFAKKRSFTNVIEECKGLAAATADLGFTPEGVLAIALGDVFQAFLKDTPMLLCNYKVDIRKYLPAIELGCSQAIATGHATTDGRLYYGVNLDCPRQPVQHWLKHTTVFVRQPNMGIPHVSIAVPGVVWTNSGINAAGIAVALNTAYPATFSEFSLSGYSHAQMMTQILNRTSSYEAASTFLLTQQHLVSNIIVVVDGKSQQAGVFELTGKHKAVRRLDKTGILYATNHFISPQMQSYDRTPSSARSLLRHKRLAQLLHPDGQQSRYGKIDAMGMRGILSDRINPDTFRESPMETYDNQASIATNGLIRQVVFDPEGLRFWIATGEVPVSNCPLVDFSLDELLN